MNCALHIDCLFCCDFIGSFLSTFSECAGNLQSPMIIIDMSEYLVFGHRRHSTGSNQLQFIVCDSSSVKIAAHKTRSIACILDIKVSARTCLLFRSSCTLSRPVLHRSNDNYFIGLMSCLVCEKMLCVVDFFCALLRRELQQWEMVRRFLSWSRASSQQKTQKFNSWNCCLLRSRKKDEKKRKTQRDAMIIAYFSTSKADLLPCSLQPTHNDEAELLIKNHWL